MVVRAQRLQAIRPLRNLPSGPARGTGPLDSRPNVIDPVAEDHPRGRWPRLRLGGHTYLGHHIAYLRPPEPTDVDRPAEDAGIKGPGRLQIRDHHGEIGDVPFASPVVGLCAGGVRTWRNRQLVQVKRGALVVVALGGQAVRLSMGIGHRAPVLADGGHRRNYVVDPVAEHRAPHRGAGRARPGPQARHRDDVVDLHSVLAVARAEAPAQHGSVKCPAPSQVGQGKGDIGNVAVAGAITETCGRLSSHK